jgi:hypothetical protein
LMQLRDLEPAVHMAGTHLVRENSDLPEITSAFLAFVEYHQVLPEAELRKGLSPALQIARAAPRQLREAKGFEDELLRPASWNAALWVAYGRSWGQPLRKPEPEPEEPVRGTTVNEADGVDDGGWTVEIGEPAPRHPSWRFNAHRTSRYAAQIRIDHRARQACPLKCSTRADTVALPPALEHISDYLHPLAITSIEVLHNIPYLRRRVTEVLPPLEPSPGTPFFMTRLHRIVTEPAPWTPEEKWRVHRRQPDEAVQQDDDDDDEEGTHPCRAESEEEAASTDFSGSITIWANVEEYGASKDALIGIGLRGRWAMMGPRDAQANAWWTFQPKDCELSALLVPVLSVDAHSHPSLLLAIRDRCAVDRQSCPSCRVATRRHLRAFIAPSPGFRHSNIINPISVLYTSATHAYGGSRNRQHTYVFRYTPPSSARACSLFVAGCRLESQEVFVSSCSLASHSKPAWIGSSAPGTCKELLRGR